MIKSLILRGEFTDLNTYIHGMNRNRFIGASIKKEETERVFYECKSAGLELIKAPVFIVFKWYCRNKKKDKDNIAFAKKGILDGLVKSGVLKNDGFDNILGFMDFFFIDKTDPRVEISFFKKTPKITFSKQGVI